jgi:hypothetical protein
MEPMSAAAVFNLQTVLSLVVFFVIAKWVVMPWLLTLGPNDALVPLLLYSAIRFTGTSFMVPSLTNGLPVEFAVTAGYGDLAVGLLALLAAIVLKMGLPFGTILAWAYAVAGALDFINAGRIASANDIPNHIGSLWPMMAVAGPSWMITIVFIIRLLIWPAPAKRA